MKALFNFVKFKTIIISPPAMTQARYTRDAVVGGSGVFMWGRMRPITRLSQVTANATPPPPSSAPYYPQASTGVTTPDFYSIMTSEMCPYSALLHLKLYFPSSVWIYGDSTVLNQNFLRINGQLAMLEWILRSKNVPKNVYQKCLLTLWQC